MSSSLPNKLFLWRDSILYLGDSFDPDMHHHHAAQCCIAFKGTLRIRWHGVVDWQNCTAALIGANVAHSIINSDGPLCLLYLEKTSDTYRSIMDYHCVTAGCEIRAEPLLLGASIPQSVCDMFLSAMSTEVEAGRAHELKQACLQLFSGKLSEPRALDPRISTLLQCLHEQPDRLFTGEALAEIVCLSESRMQHLFKQEIGIPIRRYILWTRLRSVLELALGGASVVY